MTSVPYTEYRTRVTRSCVSHFVITDCGKL